jgi:hypothetical protein
MPRTLRHVYMRIPPPILLTSSVIAHDTGVALTDTKERLRLTIESVVEWLRIDPQLQIVICDGSGYDLSVPLREKFPNAAIECLQFQNDISGVQRYGRGHGEGEIVRYALAHSRLIAQAQCFAKCSAKLWVSNFHACLAEWNGGLAFKGVFLDVFSPIRSTSLAYIDTRFYMASVEAYQRYLSDAHYRIDKAKGYGLEECFRDTILSQGLDGLLLRTPPVIAGVGGGIGKHYRNPLKRILKEKLRNWLVQHNRRHVSLFIRPQGAPD